MEPLIGTIQLFAGTFAPRGWAFCDGQLLPITSHTALFSILGTSYGGDGRTTFALPDLRGRVPIHAGTGPGLPPVQVGGKGGTVKNTLVALDNGTTSDIQTSDKTHLPGLLKTLDANVNNMQPYLGINYIIAIEGIFPSRS